MVQDGNEFYVVIPGVQAGTDYVFLTDDEKEYGDPASRWQPFGVHGASRVVDPGEFLWSDERWKGVPLEDLIIYELHTGTFTSEGTFEAIVSKLHYLRQLGVTAIELMPVAEFPGTRNWGYDGVCLYAPHSRYGGPLGLKKLVDACHREGLGVVLDVVYNHLGPEGNYLGVFAPFFTQQYRTPWGEALNFDGQHSDGVRRFYIDNALYWVTEYHVDALRLDAIHGVFDFGARHILQELAEAVHQQAARLGRTVHVIAESDLNDTRIITSPAKGGYGLDAQWLDEFHHSLRALLIDSRNGYLADFGTMNELRKAITEGFVHDGAYSNYRKKHYGCSSKDQPGRQFVVFIQNHDQVANASQGERLAVLATLEQQKLATAVTLCAPYVPLLFMGQEYGETSPFHYFASFGDPGLAEAVREGRKREFAAFAGARHFPDPNDPLTFEQSKLNWGRLQLSENCGILRLYVDLIALRRRLPCITNCRKDLTRVSFSEPLKWLVMERADSSKSRALLVCNFAASAQSIPVTFGGTSWLLELWTGAEIYSGPGNQTAPPAIVNNVESLYLGGSQAALYASGS
jgi:maltooligosyltrehalose trehalohydrolase